MNHQSEPSKIALEIEDRDRKVTIVYAIYCTLFP